MKKELVEDSQLIGKKIDNLTILSLDRTEKVTYSNGQIYTKKFFLCKCDCGNFVIREKRTFIRKRGKQSCGCARKINGDDNWERLRKIWCNIKTRCCNKNTPQYKKYGYRGIKLCPEWHDNSKNFILWGLSNGYQIGLSIDRINNNGDYEPSNCRWVNNHIQCVNQRKSKRNTSGYKGISYKSEGDKWIAYIGLYGKLVYIGGFKTKKEALDARNRFIIDNELFEYEIQKYKG